MSLIEPDVDLDPIVDVLAATFPGVVDRAQLDRLVRQTASRFASAPIREFIPVLVQHLCSDQLRSRQSA
jgi:hypothetical protein